MPNEYNAILVNVKQPPQPICFIAMPYDEEFDALASGIIRAVEGLELQPVFLKDKNKENLSFLTDIYEAIRSAKLVIAVITPAEGQQNPNVNVMYELGLAHSLGKSTVILTTSADGLPSDLSGVNVLPYSQNDVSRNSFRDSLRNEINARLIRMDQNENQLTDPSNKDISVAHARHRLFLNPLFWDHFKNILQFGKIIHKQFQAIDDSHIAFLLKHSEEICSSADGIDIRKVIEFNRMWTSFSMYYSSMTKKEVFDKLEKFKKSIPESLNQILQNAGTDEIRSTIEALIVFYEDIIRCLDSFKEKFDKIDQDTSGDFLTILKGSKSSQNLYHMIFPISKVVEHITLQADALLQNLINLIFSSQG